MPCLDALMRRGAVASLKGFAPFLSPMLAGSLATGMIPSVHGAHPLSAITEWELGNPPIGNALPKTAWEILTEAGIACGVIGWPQAGRNPPRGSTVVADSFAVGSPEASIFPPECAKLIGEFQSQPADIESGLVRLFIPSLDEIDLQQDRRPYLLVEMLTELYSFHNAAIAVAVDRQPDFLSVYLHFIEWVGQTFMAYSPPRRPEVSLRDFHRYSQVVASAYRLADTLLADLLRHCAPRATVFLVSANSIEGGSGRPTLPPARTVALAPLWNRGDGFLVALGPGLAEQTRLPELSALDVLPCLLHSLGLSPPADLPGRVPAGLVGKAAPLPRHANPVGSTGAALPGAQSAEWRHLLERRFLQLGYLGRDEKGAVVPLTGTARLNLGVALLATGQARQALPLLRETFYKEPESLGAAAQYASCLVHLGVPELASEALAAIDDHAVSNPAARLMRAKLANAEGRYSIALTQARRAKDTPSLAAEAGHMERTALFFLRRFDELAPLLEAAFTEHPDHPLIHVGLGYVALYRREYAQALARARRALALSPELPAANRLLASTRTKIDRSTANPPEAAWADLTRRALEKQEVRAETAAWISHWQAERRAHRQEPQSLAFEEVVVVSGVPRSGTSLMMRILSMAGYPTLTDGVRPPDRHNPTGYFEWAAANRLSSEPGRLAEASGGRAVKIVSSQLRQLPLNRPYRVIYLRRKPEEIALSQLAMAAGPETKAELQAAVLAHGEAILRWMRESGRFTVLEINFHDLVSRNPATFGQIRAFLGEERFSRPQMMGHAVRADLRHHHVR